MTNAQPPISEGDVWDRCQRARKVMMACSYDHMVWWAVEMAKLATADYPDISSSLEGFADVIGRVLSGEASFEECVEHHTRLIESYQGTRNHSGEEFERWQAYVSVTVLLDVVRGRLAAGPLGGGVAGAAEWEDWVADGDVVDDAPGALLLDDYTETALGYAFRAGVAPEAIEAAANRCAQAAIDSL